MPRAKTHPGEILAAEFLDPLGLSARSLAAAIDVPPNRVSDIIRQRRGITADTAIRLGRYFGTEPEYWMNLQVAHDLSMARSLTNYAQIKPRGKK